MNSLCNEALDRDLQFYSRYTLANISKSFYLALIKHVGSDRDIRVCADMSQNELTAIKTGSASVELINRTCENLYLQLMINNSLNGIVCTVTH